MICRCNRNNKGTKYRKTILLLTEELLQDIRNCGYIQSTAVKSEDPADKDVLTDVVELNNLEAATRNIDYAVGELATSLYPYSCGWKKSTNSVLTDAYHEKDSYVIALEFERNIPEQALAHLRTLCHEFVVAMAMYRYTVLAMPDASIVWRNNVDELTRQLLDTVKIGQKPLLRKLYPFC